MAYKVPSNLVKASKLLCVSVLEQCGGSAAVANSLGYNRQYVHKWITNGYVPLVQVYDVSKLLGVSQWVLSFHKLSEVFGEAAPSFESVVKKTPLLPAQKQKVLAALR